MKYLYHAVPKDMRGDILYPLNRLRELYPEAYAFQAAKYAGRERLLRSVIPTLGCLWNDVLHFSAVNPDDVKKALMAAGRTTKFAREYYRVDPKLLDPKDTTVYLCAHDIMKNAMNPDNFAPYDPDDIARYSTMPPATKEYYAETIAKGGQPLLYHRIPHILYRGTIDIESLTIISV